MKSFSNSLIQRIWKAKQAYLFISPLMLGLLLFAYYPPVSGLYHSFFDWSAFKPSVFIGLQNFKELFADRVFIESIPTMFYLSIPRLIIGIVIPFIMAEMIFAIKRATLKYWYRVLILLPMVAPGVVGLLIWKYIYDPQSGIVTAIAKALGVLGPNQIVDWLGDPSTVIPSIIFMGFPWIGGTAVLIYMSGLINISSEVIESSILDGCSTIKRIIKIDIPLVMGQIRFFLILGLIDAFQNFGIQVVMTGGGPGYSTYVPAYHMYTMAFTAGRMGYASAIGTVLFITILLLTIVSHRYLNKKS